MSFSIQQVSLLDFIIQLVARNELSRILNEIRRIRCKLIKRFAVSDSSGSVNSVFNFIRPTYLNMQFAKYFANKICNEFVDVLNRLVK